jgi:hypothetical protein
MTVMVHEGGGDGDCDCDGAADDDSGNGGDSGVGDNKLMVYVVTSSPCAGGATSVY